MIFLDSNVPMYLVGAEHPHRSEAERLLRRFIKAREKLVTDAEVFQEILHRYTAIRRPDAIEPAWEALAGIVDEIFSIHLAHVERAKLLLGDLPRLSARDALHVAVMQEGGIDRLLSFDGGFDVVPGITRIY